MIASLIFFWGKKKSGLIGFHEPTWSIVQTQTEGRLKGRLGKEGAEAAKAKSGRESRGGKIWFCTSSTVSFRSASWLIHCLVGSSKPELPISSFQSSKGSTSPSSQPPAKLKFKNNNNNKKLKLTQKRCLAQMDFFLCLHLTIHAPTPWPSANSLHSRNSLSLLLSFLVSYCYYHKYFPLTVAGAAQHSGTVITHWWKWHFSGSFCLVFPLADISVAPK